jgi:hypothetical protein
MTWNEDFQNRIEEFKTMVSQQDGEVPVSIKIRVDTGCFHRSCCPYVYRVIDQDVRKLRLTDDRFIFIEHETGPEIIVYLAVAVAGLNLATSIINLITTIIKARFEGLKHGDRHHDPVTLIIRRIKNKDILVEEKLMTFNPHDEISLKIVEKVLLEGVEKIAHPKE